MQVPVKQDDADYSDGFLYTLPNVQGLYWKKGNYPPIELITNKQKIPGNVSRDELQRGTHKGDLMIWDEYRWLSTSLKTSSLLVGNGFDKPFDLSTANCTENDILMFQNNSWKPSKLKSLTIEDRNLYITHDKYKIQFDFSALTKDFSIVWPKHAITWPELNDTNYSSNGQVEFAGDCNTVLASNITKVTSQNVLIGNVYNSKALGSKFIVIGSKSAGNVTAGSKSIIVGHNAAQAYSTLEDCIIINSNGNEAKFTNKTCKNAICLGVEPHGDNSFNIRPSTIGLDHTSTKLLTINTETGKVTYTEVKYLEIPYITNGKLGPSKLDNSFKKYVNGEWVDTLLTPLDIPKLDASYIVSGVVDIKLIPNITNDKLGPSKLDNSFKKFVNGEWLDILLAPSDIPKLDASFIVSGTFDTTLIPNITAEKITSGVLNSKLLLVDDYTLSNVHKLSVKCEIADVTDSMLCWWSKNKFVRSDNFKIVNEVVCLNSEVAISKKLSVQNISVNNLLISYSNEQFTIGDLFIVDRQLFTCGSFRVEFADKLNYYFKDVCYTTINDKIQHNLPVVFENGIIEIRQNKINSSSVLSLNACASNILLDEDITFTAVKSVFKSLVVCKVLETTNVKTNTLQAEDITCSSLQTEKVGLAGKSVLTNTELRFKNTSIVDNNGNFEIYTNYIKRLQITPAGYIGIGNVIENTSTTLQISDSRDLEQLRIGYNDSSYVSIYGGGSLPQERGRISGEYNGLKLSADTIVLETNGNAVEVQVGENTIEFNKLVRTAKVVVVKPSVKCVDKPSIVSSVFKVHTSLEDEFKVELSNVLTTSVVEIYIENVSDVQEDIKIMINSVLHKSKTINSMQTINYTTIIEENCIIEVLSGSYQNLRIVCKVVG